jgi:hypothetical protein
VKGGNLAESAYQQLKRRREQLWLSLPALSQSRADAYRLNSDALALGRTGSKYQDPREKARLGADEVTADDAMRSVQREIRRLDEEIVRASDGALRSMVGRGVGRARASR